MFEKATRLKLRFESPIGALSVDDLWDLPLTANTGKTSLDLLACDVDRKLKTDHMSFVAPKNNVDSVNQLRMDILKHVIAVRIAEADAAKTARENREKKQKILEIMARRQDDALLNASDEDLQKMLESL